MTGSPPSGSGPGPSGRHRREARGTGQRNIVIIYDSGAYSEDDRTEALRAVICDMETPQAVSFNTRAAVRHRMEAFALGAGIHLLRNTGTPIHVVRSDRHVRLGTREEIAVYVQGRGTAYLDAQGDAGTWPAGQLGAVDVTRPYGLRQSGDCDNTVLLIEFGRLDLPADLVRAAVPRLHSSPLRALVREHLLHLSVDLPADAAAMAGQATAELISALLATTGDGPRARDAAEATASARIAGWVDEHLGDADLTVGRIAAVHGMSVRALASLWRRAHGLPPGEWIARRRLERVRSLISGSPAAVHGTAGVARACGFRDATDLDRRFRAAYGVGPEELRPSRLRPGSTGSWSGDVDSGQ